MVKNNVRKWRQYRNLSQIDVAAKSRISLNRYRLIENNERIMKANEMRALAKIFEINPDQL